MKCEVADTTFSFYLTVLVGNLTEPKHEVSKQYTSSIHVVSPSEKGDISVRKCLHISQSRNCV